MELDRDLALSCREALLKKGADKAQCVLVVQEKTEFTVNAGKLDLLRTTETGQLSLMAIQDHRKGSTTLNDLSASAVEEAIQETLELAKISQPDEANDIAEGGEPRTFESGPAQADLPLMQERLSEFLDHVKSEHPRAVLDQLIFDFTKSSRLFLNSKGVDLQEDKGLYALSTMFSSKEGKKSASFNYTGYESKSLDKPLADCGSVHRLLAENARQIETEVLDGKFEGTVLISPDCLTDFLGMFTGMLGDFPLISGTSPYKDSLGEVVASPSLSFDSRPLSEEIATGSHITRDGFIAENTTILEKGKLGTFLLGLYGANKTGLPRCLSNGDCWVVAPGDKDFDALVEGIDRGVLLGRFSGGNPSENGDFSGVAKNSFLIEKGAVGAALSETMVSGNICRMLKA
ncbi:MAG TPA: TldD/PmbA family protein, partial [Planctomycetes bacterium]|nr:TldD/PmbA family protein [Planctomycetota bacterium]